MSTARSLAPWLLLAPFGVWAAVRVVGIERGYPGFQIVSCTPYVAAASVLPVALALILRRWWAAGAAAVVAVVLAVCVLPRWMADSDAVPAAASGPTIRVLSANLRYGQGDAATVVRLVREQRVDVLALQEFTPEAQQQLTAAGPTFARASLAQNSPNPFNPTTNIAYTLTAPARAVIEIVDVSGSVVARIDEGMQPAGAHNTIWNGRDDDGTPAASGVYFYRLQGMPDVAARKMVLLK